MAPKPSGHAAKARWVTETDGALGRGNEGIKSVLTRTLADLPEDLTPFAREVAVLTLHRAVQAKVLQPIMEALKKLEARTDWSGGHLVVEHYGQTWRDAPFKHYASFADFYKRELESTWGKWTDLQETWRMHVAGLLTDDEKEARIQTSRAQAMREADANAPDLGSVGRPRKNVGDKNTVANINDVTYALRRLRKDRSDLHARVLNGEITAHAAMVQAGFRTRRLRPRLSALDKIKRLLPDLTPDERAKLIKWLSTPTPSIPA